MTNLIFEYYKNIKFKNKTENNTMAYIEFGQ